MRGQNIFEKFRDYQSRKVGNPNYEPLGQSITIWNSVENKNKKRNEYMKVYREKNRDKLNEYQRNYWKNRRVLIKREWLFGIQKEVYDYLVKQYQRWENLSRWTEIARALWMKDTSVYTAIFQLVKKWYVGKWSYGRYLLTKFPDGDTTVNETPVEKEPEMVYVEENKYDEMEKKIKSLEEQVSNSVWHIDWLMNSNAELEKKNIDLLRQIEELKLLIKLLYKYFGNV